MTVRMSLPFNMGTSGAVDPYTFEQKVDHPILDIGSSQASIKQPVQEWLVNNFNNECRWGFDGKEYFIDFPSESDMVWFTLKWI